MKTRLTTIFFLIALLTAFLLADVSRVHALTSIGLNEADQALCLPYTGDTPASDCLKAGPAARLDELAAMGISYPEEQLYASLTPYELATIPFSYAQLVDDQAIPLYATLADIESGNATNQLPKSRIKYVALKDSFDTSRGRYYQIASSEWVSVDHAKKVATPNFQGYVFKQDPEFTFGWVINETISRSGPGYEYPETGIKYWRMDSIVIYDSTMVNDIEWVMVGYNEWMEHRFISRVIPNPVRPEGVPGDKWIEINLYEQTLAAYENGKLVFATLISSGVDPFFTQPGVFQIYKKLEFDPMSGSFEVDRSDYYYLEEVPYIMYYDKARAIHGAYWQSLLGYQRSHGCVNLSVADAHWIYNWANEGDYVYVWDPSGETPTDPSFYGDGGF